MKVNVNLSMYLALKYGMRLQFGLMVSSIDSIINFFVIAVALKVELY
jgi:uncharacterized membrane protein YczE